MAIDRYVHRSASPDFPAGSIIEITPDDAADLSHVTVALNVATPGRVRVTMQDGTVTDVSVAPGIAFPIRVCRVWATGTTATGLRGLI